MILCSFAFDDRSADDAVLDGYDISYCPAHTGWAYCDDVEEDEEEALEVWYETLQRLRAE